MISLHPVELFSLAIPPNGEPIPALIGKDEQATFRITMAAIDPTAPLSAKRPIDGNSTFTGSVLRIIRVPTDNMSDDEDSDDESIDMAELLNGASDSESDSEEGPSDASKSPKAKRMAQLKEAIAQAQEDDDMDVDADLSSKAKGKARAMDDDDEDDLDIDDSDIDGAEEFVLCTLDPTKAYQQTLDITVSDYETVYFRATGSHMVYLTGNVLAPVGGLGEDDYSDSEDEDDYGVPMGEDEGLYLSENDESDELDDLDDPSRITELASEDEESIPPKLIKAASGKGKNKRSAPDSSEIEEPAGVKASVDSILEKSLKPAEVGAQPVDEVKLSKTQLKKQAKRLKNNQGGAVDTTVEAKVNGEDKGIKAKEETPDKKVKFAKELVQGPSGSAQPNGDVAKAKTEKKAVDAPKVNGEAKAAAKGTKVVQGVTVEDKKVGSGPGAKKGDKVSMRYIGKLEKDKKIFDSNKKGPPFKFNLGKGEVIKGWDIGMQGIQVGGERRITIPANLAYGSKKMGDDIPANSTLVFDVKCLEIK